MQRTSKVVGCTARQMRRLRRIKIIQRDTKGIGITGYIRVLQRLVRDLVDFMKSDCVKNSIVYEWIPTIDKILADSYCRQTICHASRFIKDSIFDKFKWELFRRANFVNYS